MSSQLKCSPTRMRATSPASLTYLTTGFADQLEYPSSRPEHFREVSDVSRYSAFSSCPSLVKPAQVSPPLGFAHTSPPRPDIPHSVCRPAGVSSHTAREFSTKSKFALASSRRSSKSNPRQLFPAASCKQSRACRMIVRVPLCATCAPLRPIACRICAIVCRLRAIVCRHVPLCAVCAPSPPVVRRMCAIACHSEPLCAIVCHCAP